MVFCLEPWPPNLVRTDDDLLRMLDAVGDARMRVNFDGGNLWGAGCDSVAAARRLAPLVGHVHVKDWDRSAAPETPMWQPGPGDGPKPPNPVRGEVVLGEGEVDWPEILRILRGAGYDGWLVVERNSSKTREDDARIAVARLKSMLQKA
ncbi:MAG: Inosose dehydratase [candidate division BRC1 bacterium ADurb.BinA364]|nr:MAG: Inosose dehydratase [candidate division BRC1 bacterium ADurb.BinA364]